MYKFRLRFRHVFRVVSKVYGYGYIRDFTGSYRLRLGLTSGSGKISYRYDFRTGHFRVRPQYRLGQNTGQVSLRTGHFRTGFGLTGLILRSTRYNITDIPEDPEVFGRIKMVAQDPETRMA